MTANSIQQINRVMLLACAPFLGMLIWLLFVSLHISIPVMMPQASTPINLGQETTTLTAY